LQLWMQADARAMPHQRHVVPGQQKDGRSSGEGNRGGFFNLSGRNTLFGAHVCCAHVRSESALILTTHPLSFVAH